MAAIQSQLPPFLRNRSSAGAGARPLEMLSRLAHMDVQGARETMEELLCLAVWNRVHRIEDAVWDPRGKRALFGGLDVKRPRILFLGAAEGYEAMQLHAMYPGGEVVLVDYDEFCKTDRFGLFPEAYPFLGVDPSTGHKRVWYREEMPIHYEVADIRDLHYGKEFDIVVSIGLVEHFPDEHKPLAFEFHRRFLKPGRACHHHDATQPDSRARVLHDSFGLHELRLPRADGHAAAGAVRPRKRLRDSPGGIHQGAQRAHLPGARG